MSQEYSRGVLRVAVAQICQSLGWNSIHSMPLELLTDVLERYLLQMGKVTHRYSEQFGRTTARLEDIGLAFSHMGIKIPELEDYLSHIDPLPFAKEAVSFPIPCERDLKFPNPESREVQQRKVFEFVPEHLPYMHPELNEDEDPEPLPPRSPEKLQVEQQPQSAELSPGQGEKRLLSSPGEAGGPFKRPRLTTSQPLPEEAFHSQHEMTSVVMTNSGILSPLREGKLPDTKPPPTGFKQIVIVKQKSSSGAPTQGVKLSNDTPIIKLDFSQEAGTSKIVEVDKEGGNDKPKLDKSDPDFVPKKKKLKDNKKVKLLKEKIKKGPGRPKSPGRAAVVHNKGAAGVSKILSLSKKDGKPSKLTSESKANEDSPMDLSTKPTPPMPGINVRVDDSAKSKSDHTTQKVIEYRPKVIAISKQQEKDMEDTIASVIEKSSREVDSKFEEAAKEAKEEKRKEEKRKEEKRKEEKEKRKEEKKKEEKRKEEKKKEEKKKDEKRSVSPHEKVKPVKRETVESESDKDTWRVSHISETYSGDNDDSFDHVDDDDDHDDDPIVDHKEEKVENGQESSSYHPPGQYLAPHLAFLKAPTSSPSPPSKTRGRPRGSTSGAGFGMVRSPRGSRRPGRPPLNKSPGRAASSVSRSPGRPPLNRSPGPGRPSLNRSPGRPPGSGRSPGRPKGSTNLSPKPRGRPRGSKSPRSRVLSPRGTSPRAIAHINFDEDTPGVNSRLLQDQGEESETKLFGYPSVSPSRDSFKDRSPTPTGSIKADKRSPTPSPSPKFTPERRDISPDGKLPLSLKREPTPDTSYVSKEPSPTKRDSSVESDLARRKERSYDFDDDDDPPSSRSDSWKEPLRIKEERSLSREKESQIFMKYKDRSSERETSREKDSPMFEDRDSSERDYSVPSRDPEISKEKERDRKEHSRDRDHHSKDRDRERSKEHKKDKKKKKKKDKEKDRDRDRDKDRERKDKHKKEKEKEKEHREESPSVQPLQKLTIKFGGGSTKSPGLFSITKTQTMSSPKPEAASPPQRPEIPKMKFKVLPPKPDADTDKGDPPPQSRKSSIKIEPKSSPSPKPEPVFPSKHLASPKSSSDLDVESVKVKQESPDKRDSAGKEEEVTVSLAVVGGKILGQKPIKRKKKGQKGQKGKTKDSKKPFIKTISAPDTNDEDTQPAMEDEPEKEDPLSPLYPNQNVPSPITIPALKAAPPPPSPPTNKKSPPKPKTLTKEPRPQSPPMFKDIGKTKPPKPPPVQIPKKSPRRSSPRKSPKISPLAKKKPGIFSQPSPTKTTPPPSKSSSFSDSLPPKSPSPSRMSSPSFSPIASPMYSPASSPARDSPLHFMIPPTPAFPTRTNSPPLSTDEEEKEVTSPTDRPQMPPPLPPMPPSAQKKGARTVVAETVGSFVNECGEKIWICPACTMQDDGSPMIGCDQCDDWYHWVCVNIVEEPSEEESWYCPKCVRPNKAKGKRGRKKKKP